MRLCPLRRYKYKEKIKQQAKTTTKKTINITNITTKTSRKYNKKAIVPQGHENILCNQILKKVLRHLAATTKFKYPIIIGDFLIQKVSSSS